MTKQHFLLLYQHAMTKQRLPACYDKTAFPLSLAIPACYNKTAFPLGLTKSPCYDKTAFTIQASYDYDRLAFLQELQSQLSAFAVV